MYPRTKSRIDHSTNSWFNWGGNGVKRFLRQHCESFWCNESDDRWEIDRDEFVSLVKWLRKETKKNPDSICIKDDNIEYSNTEALSIFEEILKVTSNKHNFNYPDIIYLDWM